MASLPQMSATLGASMSSNKIINPRPCIAQLCNNLVANHQIAKGYKKPIIELRKQSQNEKWKARVGDDAPELLPPHSLIETTVQDFYRAFNAKDIEKLKQLLVLDDKFVYQDFLFYSPYHRQGVINFWQNVMDAMGPNIKIAVESIKEDHLMATVFWHLEWQKWKLPYTNGCRFFWFEEDDGRLVISKITGLEELPLKPGELLINVLKVIRTFLDTYPPVAAALLNSYALEDGTHMGEGHDMP